MPTVTYYRYMYKLAIKNAFLFVGAMIGAGFATGAELMVFFGRSDIFTVILAAVVIGGMSIVFVYFGRVMALMPRMTRILDIVMVLSSVITFIAMQAGVEELLSINYGIVGIGLATAIVISILSAFSLNFAKVLNIIAIPIVIVLVIVLGIVAEPVGVSGAFMPAKAIGYAGMNLMLGGYLIAKDSSGMRFSHSIVMAIIIFIITATMMVLIFILSSMAKGQAMPIYSLALTHGLGVVAAIIIYLAILTTIIGSGKVITMWLEKSLLGRWTGSLFLVSMSVVSYGISFKYIVDTFYPITGYLGVVVIIMMTSGVAYQLVKRKCRNKGIKEKTSRDSTSLPSVG